MFISSVITINENGLNTGIKKQINSMGVFKWLNYMLSKRDTQIQRHE